MHTMFNRQLIFILRKKKLYNFNSTQSTLVSVGESSFICGNCSETSFIVFRTLETTSIRNLNSNHQ